MSGFESQFTRHFAQIAQSVEQGTENPCVRGSIPRLGTIKKYFICLGGEIGRRTGLKILWKQFRAGSSPARGTIKEKRYAGVAQLVERQPSKLNVASSTLVSRSKLRAISSVGRALDF